jgi:hypothetical protein
MLEVVVVIVLVAAFAVVAGVAGLTVHRIWTASDPHTGRDQQEQ